LNAKGALRLGTNPNDKHHKRLKIADAWRRRRGTSRRATGEAAVALLKRIIAILWKVARG
jgi:hypothetical protein